MSLLILCQIYKSLQPLFSNKLVEGNTDTDTLGITYQLANKNASEISLLKEEAEENRKLKELIYSTQADVKANTTMIEEISKEFEEMSSEHGGDTDPAPEIESY